MVDHQWKHHIFLACELKICLRHIYVPDYQIMVITFLEALLSAFISFKYLFPLPSGPPQGVNVFKVILPFLIYKINKFWAVKSIVKIGEHKIVRV